MLTPQPWAPRRAAITTIFIKSLVRPSWLIESAPKVDTIPLHHTKWTYQKHCGKWDIAHFAACVYLKVTFIFLNLFNFFLRWFQNRWLKKFAYKVNWLSPVEMTFDVSGVWITKMPLLTAKGEIAAFCNFLFCHNVFKKSSAQRRQKQSIWGKGRVKGATTP